MSHPVVVSVSVYDILGVSGFAFKAMPEFRDVLECFLL